MATTTHTRLLDGGRVRNVLPSADAFDVDCDAAFVPTVLVMREATAYDADYLALTHDDALSPHVVTVDHEPANLPA